MKPARRAWTADHSTTQKWKNNPTKRLAVPSSPPTPSASSSLVTSRTPPPGSDLLREGFDRSPMFNGRIRGLGPRYCPSIEDKIDRFADKDRHQVFVEPEGWNTCEIYVNGFSTSLPEDVQLAAMRKIPGFEQAKMFRPGYAIEYDYFPTQLQHSLETRLSGACTSQAKSTEPQATRKPLAKELWRASTRHVPRGTSSPSRSEKAKPTSAC